MNIFNNKIVQKSLMLLVLSVVLIAVIAFWYGVYVYIIDNDWFKENFASEEEYSEEAECNVRGIEIRGELATYNLYAEESDAENGYDLTASEEVIMMIEDANSDPAIKAILLEIESGGGWPVAAEEIASAIGRANKPTVAWIRQSGMSAAYWAASAADVIFASALSDIGSIGVTNSYLDNIEKNRKEGLGYNELSSGKFKDTLSPDKPLTEEEKQLIMRDVNITYEYFIKTVASNRNLEIEKVRSMADGSTMMGDMALENGLIDRIGGYFEVKDYLKEKIGEEPEFCW